jgi:hypothetical protein
MSKYVVIFLFIASVAPSASAQALSVGVLGGIPLSNTSAGHDESPRYQVGASFEVGLPAGFALEADALYRRLGSSSGYSLLTGTNLVITPVISTTPFLLNFNSRQRGNAWSFPLLGKYYFHTPTASWRPFVGTGFAFRTIDRHDSGSQIYTDANGALQTAAFKNNYRSPLEVGAVIAAGMRLKAGRFAVLPQVRYTRWGGADSFASRNETTLMLGLSF